VTAAGPAPGAVQVSPARTPEDIAAVRELFLEYSESLDVDLCFEGFEEEVGTLPGAYRPPSGTLLLARDANGAVGCAGLRRLAAGVAELKRVYVRPRGRGRGTGRRLVEAALDAARVAEYKTIQLDTLPSMTAAIALYATLGFHEILPPGPNPIAGTRYFQRRLDARGRGTSK
jgi:GNAT superfamily N-acetyltransferase